MHNKGKSVDGVEDKTQSAQKYT